HLLSRCARDRRVFYVEAPAHSNGEPLLEVVPRGGGLHVATLHLPAALDSTQRITTEALLLERLLTEQEINDYVLWFYDPVAFAFASKLEPLAIVYDCMRELSTHPEAT